MGWLWAILVGFVLGMLAKAILPGRQHSPIWLTTAFGILGAVVGNSLAASLGIAETRGVDWGRHLLQLAAAVLIVGIGDALYTAYRDRREARAGPRTPY